MVAIDRLMYSRLLPSSSFSWRNDETIRLFRFGRPGYLLRRITSPPDAFQSTSVLGLAWFRFSGEVMACIISVPRILDLNGTDTRVHGEFWQRTIVQQASVEFLWGEYSPRMLLSEVIRHQFGSIIYQLAINLEAYEWRRTQTAREKKLVKLERFPCVIIRGEGLTHDSRTQLNPYATIFFRLRGD